MSKLRIAVPEEWERWAHKHQPFERDPERPAKLEEATLLQRPHKYPRLWLPTGHIVPMPMRGGARLFDDASSQYLEADSAPVNAAPLSMSIWFKTDTLVLNDALMWLGDKDVQNKYWGLFLLASTDRMKFDLFDNAATAGLSHTANSWNHGCGVDVSSTSHSAFLNGGNKGNITTSIAPTGADRISIGHFGDSSPSIPFSGDLAEACIWNVALSDADVAAAAKNVSPLLAPRPESLVYYCPIIGNYSPEIDIVGGIDMTVTGATKSAHPRIFYPPRRSGMPFAIAGGAPPAATHAPARTLLGVGV